MTTQKSADRTADAVNAARKRQFRWAVVIVTVLSVVTAANFAFLTVGAVRVNDLTNRVGHLRGEVEAAETRSKENRDRIIHSTQIADALDERFEAIVAELRKAIRRIQAAPGPPPPTE